jgi:IPT/TIG domain
VSVYEKKAQKNDDARFPKEGTMPPIEVHPQSAVLSEKQTQAFSATTEGKPIDVTWSIEPSTGSGSIDASGTYRAPRWVFRDRKAAVIATGKQAGPTPGRATVEISSASFWTLFLGAYCTVVAITIMTTLVQRWEHLCPACESFGITPPVVTLGKGQAQQFRANTGVRWSAELDGTGIYRAPSDDSGDTRVTVTATTLREPIATATATIYLSGSGGLALNPSSAVVQPGTKLQLVAIVEEPTVLAPDLAANKRAKVVWMEPEAGKLESNENGVATFTAPDAACTRPILILARTDEIPPRLAGTAIRVTTKEAAQGSCEPGGGPAFRGMLILIFLMGATGGLIHGISSFAIYAGNRELLPSWVWWYCMKPLLGALVALAVYLVFRAGLGSADYSLGTADCVKVAAFSVLIGLFAENATLKLKDIFETLFTPREDPRRNKAGAGALADPVISSLEPAFLVVGGGVKTLLIKGTGFGSESQVRVAGDMRKPSKTPTASTIELDLTPEDQGREGQLIIQVVNTPPDGRASNQVSLEVKKP